jgi:hypothetical protein
VWKPVGPAKAACIDGRHGGCRVTVSDLPPCMVPRQVLGCWLRKFGEEQATFSYYSLLLNLPFVFILFLFFLLFIYSPLLLFIILL